MLVFGLTRVSQADPAAERRDLRLGGLVGVVLAGAR